MKKPEGLCAMCAERPARFTSLVPSTHDHVRFRRALCEVCTEALGVYLDSIIDRVAEAVEKNDDPFAASKALEQEAEVFVEKNSSKQVAQSIDELLDALGVKHG